MSEKIEKLKKQLHEIFKNQGMNDELLSVSKELDKEINIETRKRLNEYLAGGERN